MAGTKVRGITIELGADATGISTALESISSEISHTSSQLRDVNKLLKLDPTNTTLVTQKTKLLQDQIASTTTKLDQLKAAQATLDENGVDKTSDQYMALQREIVETEEKLKSLKNTVGSGSAALAQISAVTGKLGEGMENVGKKLMPVSAGITAGLVGAAKTAIDFETAFAGVQKTVDGTPEQLETIRQGIIDLSQNTASSATEIAAVAEAAGQLGISTDDVLAFTETMIMLGDTTNLSADEAASALAKFANITGTSASDYGRLGSTIVELGNNFATTERDIVDMASRLASAGTLAGLTEPEILALSTAMSSVGIEAAAGGTAMSQTLTTIEKAVASSGEELDKIAQIAGMSSEEFSAAWEGRPIDAITAFITGLGHLDEQGESATLVLDELGMSGVRQSNMLKSLALASDMMTGAVSSANGAWSENTALSDEANKKYETTGAKIAQLKATLAEVGIELGRVLLPFIKDAVEWLKNITKQFASLDDGTKKTIVTIAGMTAAAGPLLVTGGKVLKGISSITGALSKMGGVSAGPIGLVIAGIGALLGAGFALAESWNQAYKAASPYTEKLKELADDNDRLTESIANSKASYDEAVTASESSAYAAEALYGKLQNLIAAYDGTAASSATIETVVSELNELVPGLGLAWDSVTGSLNLTTAEVYANIDALKAQAQAAALQDLYTQTLKEQYEAQKNARESMQTLVGVMQQYGVTAQELNSLIADGNVTVGEGIEFLRAHGVEYDKAQGYAEELAGALGEYIQARQNQKDVDETVLWAEEMLGEAMVNAATKTQEASTQTSEVVQQTYGTEIPAAMETAAGAATTTGEEIGANTAEGIVNSTPQVQTAAAEMSDAVINEFSGTPAEMNAAGSETGQNLNEGFGGWRGTVSGTIDDMYQLFYDTLGTILPSIMNTWGSNAGQKYNSGFKLWQSDVEKTASKYVTGIRDNLESLPANTRNIGDQAGRGMYNGLSAWQGTLSSLAWSIANSINAAARQALQIRSPSRVLERTFEYAGEGAELGLKKSGRGVLAQAINIVGSVEKAFNGAQLALSMNAANVAANQAAQVRSTMATSQNGAMLTQLTALLNEYMPILAADRDIYFNDGAWAGRLAPEINKKFAQIAKKGERG